MDEDTILAVVVVVVIFLTCFISIGIALYKTFKSDKNELLLENDTV